MDNFNLTDIQDKELNSDRVTPNTTINVIEEQVNISKRLVETAKVTLSKVVSEETQQGEIPYTEENISVERIAKNEYIGAMPPAVRYEGDTMIIPVVKEVVVVEKRLMLVEELHVTKHKIEKSQAYEVTLKKEAVEVTRTALTGL